MTATSTDDIYGIVTEILYKMTQDTGMDEEIEPETWLVADLGFESIDVVVFGTTLQERFDDELPLAEYLTEIGKREIRDIKVEEFVAFVKKHVDGKTP